jgi:esterase/lipase
MSAERHTILFLHSALGTVADMQPLMSLMNEHGFRTMSFNFGGHGEGSLWPSEFRIESFARELDKYIHDHALKDLIIFGHSMGGYIALFHKAHFESSPISMIFTYGTKFNWSEKSVVKELPMLNPEYLLEKFPAFAEQLKKKHGEERWKHLLLSTAHMMQNLERLDGLTREDLWDVEIPVILMLGDQDRMVSTEETQLTKSWLSHGEVRTIAHSRHEMEKANLKEIVQCLQEYII